MSVTEQDVLPLMQMGFEPREIRIGLRATGKNLSVAIQYILNVREKKRLRREEEKKRILLRKKAIKWGKTKSGNLIDLSILKTLKSMGFEKKLAAEALKQTDNSEDLSIKLLTESPHLLTIRDPKPYIPTQEQIDQVTAMGFEAAQAAGALKASRGDIQKAMDMLLAGQVFEPEPETPNLENKVDPVKPSKDLEQESLDLEISELIKDVNENDDDSHLDFTLEDETQILEQYRNIMQQAMNN
eukprot:TRINITY_DN10208_c0_g1_i1.p2 TRINITY_DN10208_c0_g1~~TRINITY_DN10208_c0_g1_i1.p2  ORF type:complete len:242 (+),score=65.74 TRINITY_DN10208_c0_g1_i1:895-1620(+)